MQQDNATFRQNLDAAGKISCTLSRMQSQLTHVKLSISDADSAGLRAGRSLYPDRGTTLASLVERQTQEYVELRSKHEMAEASIRALIEAHQALTGTNMTIQNLLAGLYKSTE